MRTEETDNPFFEAVLLNEIRRIRLLSVESGKRRATLAAFIFEN